MDCQACQCEPRSPPTCCEGGEEPSKFLQLPTMRRRKKPWRMTTGRRKTERHPGRARRPLRLLRKMQLFALLVRLFLGHDFTNSLVGPYRTFPPPSLRQAGIEEVHGGLERYRVLHLCQHCVTSLNPFAPI